MKRFLKIFLVLVMTFMMSGSVLAKEVDHFKSDIDNSAEIKDDVINSSWKFNWSELYGELGERRV